MRCPTHPTRVVCRVASWKPWPGNSAPTVRAENTPSVRAGTRAPLGLAWGQAWAGGRWCRSPRGAALRGSMEPTRVVRTVRSARQPAQAPVSVAPLLDVEDERGHTQVASASASRIGTCSRPIRLEHVARTWRLHLEPGPLPGPGGPAVTGSLRAVREGRGHGQSVPVWPRALQAPLGGGGGIPRWRTTGCSSQWCHGRGWGTGLWVWLAQAQQRWVFMRAQCWGHLVCLEPLAHLLHPGPPESWPTCTS